MRCQLVEGRSVLLGRGGGGLLMIASRKNDGVRISSHHYGHPGQEGGGGHVFEELKGKRG